MIMVGVCVVSVVSVFFVLVKDCIGMLVSESVCL